VAHNKNGSFTSNRLNLLEGSKDKDSSLSKTRLGLTNDIGSQDSLRNNFLLNCIYSKRLESFLFSKLKDRERVSEERGKVGPSIPRGSPSSNPEQRRRDIK
jgi:hypothetical protein